MSQFSKHPSALPNVSPVASPPPPQSQTFWGLIMVQDSWAGEPNVDWTSQSLGRTSEVVIFLPIVGCHTGVVGWVLNRLCLRFYLLLWLLYILVMGNLLLVFCHSQIWLLSNHLVILVCLWEEGERMLILSYSVLLI